MKLESDEEEEPVAPEPTPAPVLTMEPSQEEEEVPPIQPISAAEEKVKPVVTAPKAAPRSSRDEDKVIY